MYDDTGKLLDDSRDVCDCLEEDCDGCHFPCLKCDSTKCGHECRCSRRWIYEQVQIEGSKASFYFPMSWPASGNTTDHVNLPSVQIEGSKASFYFPMSWPASGNTRDHVNLPSVQIEGSKVSFYFPMSWPASGNTTDHVNLPSVQIEGSKASFYFPMSWPASGNTMDHESCLRWGTEILSESVYWCQYWLSLCPIWWSLLISSYFSELIGGKRQGPRPIAQSERLRMWLKVYIDISSLDIWKP